MIELTDTQSRALWKIIGDMPWAEQQKYGLTRDESVSMTELYNHLDDRPEYREGNGE